MADLVARGPDPSDGWRRPVPAAAVTLGRTAPASAWDAPWDQKISARHATLTWQGQALRVRRVPRARNPIFFRGRPLDDFLLGIGDTFVIGETTFTLVAGEGPAGSEMPTRDLPGDLPQPDAELTCSHEELCRVPYLDAGERIEVLAALPEMIRFSPGDAELEARVVDVLLRGIPRAGAAAIVRLRPALAGEPEVDVRAVTARDPRLEPLRPSRRLIVDAVSTRRQSVLYRWDVKADRADFTAHAACDWALCVPLPDDPLPGWGLYVAGPLREARPDAPPAQDLLKGDLKFTEVVADIFGSLRQVRDLQRRQTQLTSFLSRPVVAALAQQDIEAVLRPREAEVTVLFCDLRGSCRLIDEGRDDLPGLWERISTALGIMTGSIIDQDGVVGDFQGDAAMGFWGWPLEVPDQVERAARAALTIRRHFARAAREPGNPLAGLGCGVGIAHGPAIAGKLGTPDQFKVGVFGPVVNLAARLESMTRQFRVPILLDDASARQLARTQHSHWCRCRRLARVQPHGMLTTLTVSELLPPLVEPGAMPERDRRDYEAALDAFFGGRWPDAGDLLRRLPHDGPAERLRAFMEGHHGEPPAGWDGVMVLEAK
jgi:adenylate cyclase